jgi:hypothetical protein
MDQGNNKCEIDDKEMLVIVSVIKEWRRYLKGAAPPINVFTNHKNCKYLTTAQILNRRHVCWAQELAGFDLNLFYQPGSSDRKPVATSRRSKYPLKKGGGIAEEYKNQPIHRILIPDQLVTSEGKSVQVTAMKL